MRARFILVAAFAAVAAGGVARAQSASCPAHAAAYKTEETADATIIHCRCVAGYHASGGACVLDAPAPLSCTVAQARIDADLREIQEQRDLAAKNQAQLADAHGLGTKGLTDLLKAAAQFSADRYGQNANEVNQQVDKLEQQAEIYAEGVNTLKYNPDRYLDLQLLKRTSAELRTVKFTQAKKIIASEGPASWVLARDTMNNGFVTAAAFNGQLATELNDPKFQTALFGEEADTHSIRYDTMANTLKAALSVVADNAKFLADYTEITGPTITYTSFVIDGAYADLELWFAAKSADQADQNAGQLARAAGLMQAKYQRDFQARQTCTP